MTTITTRPAMLGKIQNNVEEETPEFKFPVQLMMQPDELAKFLNDKKFVEGLFVKNGNSVEPSPAAKEIGRMKLGRSYDGANVVMQLVDESEADFEGCILDSFSFEVIQGGVVSLWFHLYLKPGIGNVNLQLQEHQNHEVQLTVSDATLALKARQKQQDLPLGDPDSTYAGNDPDPPPRDERAEPRARKSRRRGAVAEATH